MMNNYINLFIDTEYPKFLDKYLNTKTLIRLKDVTQFCGCDYTKLYSPSFLYTRFEHSLVVAHMTWHFTHDKESTICALLHDIGTPCFAHCIDYVFGDYLNQESSEKNLSVMIMQDQELLDYLEEDHISLSKLENLNFCPILENESPQLCTDRLDGVLHTCYIWLHTHSLEDIKEVYSDIEVLMNEYGEHEIGFKHQAIAEKFASMVFVYAKELQGNTDKYTMKYISKLVKLSFEQNLLTLEDLYTKKEKDIVTIFETNFASWKSFNEASVLIRTEDRPTNFYISFDTKKRNTIPLIITSNGNKRISSVSSKAKDIYDELKEYKDSKYAYIEAIKEL